MAFMGVTAKLSILTGLAFDVLICVSFAKEKEKPDWGKLSVWTFIIVLGMFFLLSIFYGIFLLIKNVF